jgi:hypothetical protein
VFCDPELIIAAAVQLLTYQAFAYPKESLLERLGEILLKN